MSKVRIDVIGCGMIANRHHIPCYKVNNDVEIAYFCDIIREKAEQSAAGYGSGKVVTDYKKILDDPTVEAVDICTPNLMHSVIAIDAMRAGKHVLCEKPAAINYDEALKMQQVCHEPGKVLNIGVVNRFEGHINMIRKHIQEGSLGEIYHVYASFRATEASPASAAPSPTRPSPAAAT